MTGALSPTHWLGHPRRRPAALRRQAQPDAARGIGRSLRIFKAETKALSDDGESPSPAGGRPRRRPRWRPPSSRPGPRRRPARRPRPTPSRRGTPTPRRSRPCRTCDGCGRAAGGPVGGAGTPTPRCRCSTTCSSCGAVWRGRCTRGGGRHGSRIRLVRERGLRGAHPGLPAARALLLPAVVGARRPGRRRVPAARHRAVRPVRPAAQGRDHRRRGPVLAGVARAAVGVRHPRVAARTSAGARCCSSAAPRCSSPGAR